MSWNEKQKDPSEHWKNRKLAEAMTLWRLMATSHNRAFGLNKRALDFLFDKSEAHISRFIVMFFFLPKTSRTHLKIYMIVSLCPQPPQSHRSRTVKLWFLPHISTNATQSAIDAELFSVLYQMNWIPKAIDIRDTNAGLKCWGWPKF